MKTTLDIRDELILRAKKLARRTGRPLRAVVEDGLQMVLSASARDQSYELPDCSVGDADAQDPLEALSWHDLRDEIYGSPRPR